MRWVAPTRADVVVAAAATVYGVVSVAASGPAPASGVQRAPDAFAIVLAVAATTPIVLRRAAPFVVLVVMCAAVLWAALRGSAVAAGGLGPGLAVVSAAYLTDRRGAIVAGVTFAVSALVGTHIALEGQPGEGVQLASTLALALLATLVGDVLRTLEERNRQLEALRERENREAVAEERVRIARDMHDVVGHALVGITLQARAGRRLLERDHDRAAEALDTIDRLAGTALQETREAIGAMRDPHERADLRPAPGLEDLDDLVGGLQEADVHVQLIRQDVGDDVATAVQAAAFRIVQEALSNVAKHARPASAVVTVAARGGALEVEVRDDGRRAPRDDGSGHGLLGMRERAAQCGGELQAGPRADGGWTVSATLPIGGRG